MQQDYVLLRTKQPLELLRVLLFCILGDQAWRRSNCQTLAVTMIQTNKTLKILRWTCKCCDLRMAHILLVPYWSVLATQPCATTGVLKSYPVRHPEVFFKSGNSTKD